MNRKDTPSTPYRLQPATQRLAARCTTACSTLLRGLQQPVNASAQCCIYCGSCACVPYTICGSASARWNSATSAALYTNFTRGLIY